jgi:hypothetical protein
MPADSCVLFKVHSFSKEMPNSIKNFTIWSKALRNVSLQFIFKVWHRLGNFDVRKWCEKFQIVPRRLGTGADGQAATSSWRYTEVRHTDSTLRQTLFMRNNRCMIWQLTISASTWWNAKMASFHVSNRVISVNQRTFPQFTIYRPTYYGLLCSTNTLYLTLCR